MSFSVNTNESALIALRNLSSTQGRLAEVQNRISTGLEVDGAEDNPGRFAVAQGLRADVGAYDAVDTSLDRAISIANVALAAGEAISDLLIELRTTATAASDPSIDTFARQAFDTDLGGLIDQIRVIVENASFDGANLLNDSLTNGIRFLADAAATQFVTLGAVSLSFGGATLTFTQNASVLTSTNANTVRSQAQASLDLLNRALGDLGSDLQTLEAHRTFVGRLSDELNVGIGNLVDADLAAESAQLQALQVSQQLGAQALSISNQAPQILLSLFGG